MSLVEREASESFANHYADATGNTMLTLQAQYGKNVIAFTASMFNEEYVAEHKAEIEEAFSTFLERLNARLSENNLPSIHVAESAS